MRRKRSGFTLIELLVVAAIIGVLSSLGAWAYFKTIAGQKRKSTQATLTKLHTMSDRQRKAVIDDARTEPIPSSVVTLAGGDPNRARVIWIKLRLKQQFPQTFAAALQPAPGYITPEPAYGKILAGRSAAVNPATESAACLLMALTARGRRGANVDADFLNSLEKADTDGDGIFELVDGWSHPLAFFPWPTPPAADANYAMLTTAAPIGLNPLSPSQFQDVEDPTGTLLAAAWLGSANGTTFQGLCHPVQPGVSGFGQFMTPMIVSAADNPTGSVWLNPNMSLQPAPSSPNTYNIYMPSPVGK